MAGIIEKIAKTAATLTQPNGTIVDGVPQTTNVSCMAFRMGGVRTMLNEYGQIAHEITFLVSGLTSDPVLPASLTFDNVTYVLSGIKPYRNMQGVLLGYKMTAAGL